MSLFDLYEVLIGDKFIINENTQILYFEDLKEIKVNKFN
jgi:hypothetical protein